MKNVLCVCVYLVTGGSCGISGGVESTITSKSNRFGSINIYSEISLLPLMPFLKF